MMDKTPLNGWIIYDEETQMPYVQKAWHSFDRARMERTGMLKPYRKGHYWRSRLTVRHTDKVELKEEPRY